MGILGMEADRKRKRPAEDWEGKRRRIGRDVGKPCGGRDEAAAAEAGRPAAEDDVEDEVEEFFAIVHRMHDAARLFSVDGAGRGGRMAAACGGQAPREEEEGAKGFNRWRPAFEWEDFEEASNRKLPGTGDGRYGRRAEVASPTSAPIAAVGRVGKREERTAENGIAVCLDLNAEPEPESVLG